MSGKIRLNTSSVKLNTDKILLGVPPTGTSWSFVESNNNTTAFSPRVVTTTVSGFFGCGTAFEASELLDSVFPANNYNIGDYARVTIADSEFNLCTNPSFHWFVVI
jgi:hypothetical protein